jgi:hypothetical protein
VPSGTQAQCQLTGFYEGFNSVEGGEKAGGQRSPTVRPVPDRGGV